MTMVKAEINEQANQYVEYIQDKQNLNKADALAYIVEEQARDWDNYDSVNNE